jgi:uncharacterized OB-fold protein
MVPVCTSCGKKAWPPSAHCPSCFAKTKLENVKVEGTLVEFAGSSIQGREGVFGVVEMDGFRLVGSLDGINLHRGMRVKMTACGTRADGSPFYRFASE